jgi:uncharacterized protein
MMLALRSVKLAVLAMIPNLVPVGIVFGALGWLKIPVDIGMMMTGSIALGISIDGTFHFLARYVEQSSNGRGNTHAVRVALMSTGGPIFESIVVSSIGMLALYLSSFAPTARFGILMGVLLAGTLSGTLLLLPALLSVRAFRKPDLAANFSRLAIAGRTGVVPNPSPASLSSDRVA